MARTKEDYAEIMAALEFVQMRSQGKPLRSSYEFADGTVVEQLVRFSSHPVEWTEHCESKHQRMTAASIPTSNAPAVLGICRHYEIQVGDWGFVITLPGSFRYTVTIGEL